MGRILFLALALFAFCTWNSPTVAVAGQDGPTNLPHGWQKVDAKYFSIYAPPGWKFHKLVGIDSYVGEFVGDGIRLTFDYGQYSNSLPANAKEPAYSVVEEQVGGHLAKIVNPKGPDHGVTAIFFRDVGDTNGLYIDGRNLSASQQKTALMMFRTIRFRAALTQSTPAMDIVRVEDLPQFALKLFEIEKKLLLKEKQEYSCSVVIVITPDGRHYWEEVVFNDETEMDAAYGAIVVRAKSKRATAIITISTVRTKDVADQSELESYWWGKLAAENQPRCLFLTISGPNLKSVSISLPFSVENNQVVLGTQTDFEPTIVNMLPNWP